MFGLQITPDPSISESRRTKTQSALTFWSGNDEGGHGRGSFHILNQSYVEIKYFQVNGFGDDMGDLHELTITDDDTALVTIYHKVPWDLTDVGGNEDSVILDCMFQELNIESGELVFQWNASAHVGINESYKNLGDNVSGDDPWDYFHINWVEKDAKGDYIVSQWVMSCIYTISAKNGHIIWRLNGKQSDFEVESAATFAFQHDARWTEDNIRMTLFDNGLPDHYEYSRVLRLDVNQDGVTVILIQHFTNDARTFTQYEGNSTSH